ncbi:MAG: polysaccharide pyruvyl transferase CsaB [Elusimicrobiota bacterium]|nr:polysaccharide pyruvyl transferase CsaB [Elusimicrobiota bacterium]
MSDILISGYYGFKNAGDELILKAIIMDLRRYKPDVTITVLSATPDETSNSYNVYAVNRWNIFSAVKEIAKCKMLLSGSGGLFQDTTGILSLWYYLLIILTAKIFGKIVFVYAAGIGEIKYAFNNFLIKKCFNKVDFITVRTEQDKDLLKSFAVSKEIIVTSDPVFGLELPKPETKSTFGNGKKQKIGIILRKTKNWKKDVKVFSELSDLIVKNLKAEVVFIPFQLSKDIKLLNLIKHNVDVPIDIFAWNDTEKLLELFSKLDIIVSMRLHGLILSAKYKIPFVAIPRYSKIKIFLQLIGEPIYSDNGEIKNEKIYLQILDKTKGKKNPEKISAVVNDLQNKSKKTAELCISVLTRS